MIELDSNLRPPVFEWAKTVHAGRIDMLLLNIGFFPNYAALQYIRSYAYMFLFDTNMRHSSTQILYELVPSLV
jgi:hypothetical protein